MARRYKCYMRVCHALLWMQYATGLPLSPPTRKPQRPFSLSQHAPEVWVQEAEAGFVDKEENLEEGEVCQRSVKAFASSIETETSILRFLGAGALVQRPGDSLVCDAWTADAILDEGGPNLKLQGACQILDDLLLFHLQQHQRNGGGSILGLQTFVVKCGGGLESESSCASYMAAMSRGFHPLREMIRKSSIYSSALYNHDLDGLVMDAAQGKRFYKTISEQGDKNSTASLILDFLPGDETIQRHTTKRFTVQQSPTRNRMNGRKLP